MVNVNSKKKCHYRFFISFLFLLPITLLIMTGVAGARDNDWLSSFSYMPSYDSNVYYTEKDKKSEVTSTFFPSVLLTSRGKTDTLELNYAPNILWNHRRKVYDVGQNFSLEAERDFSSSLSMNFREDFNYFDISSLEFISVQSIQMRFTVADDYYKREVARILFPEIVWTSTPADEAYVLSQLGQRYQDATLEDRTEVDKLLARDVGGERRRLWRNEISFQTEYEFARESIIELGYNLYITNDISARLPDMDINNPHISLRYRFNERWRAEASYDYRRTNYDISPDSTDHISYLQIDFQPGHNDLVFGRYSFSYLNYDEGRSDQNNKEGELGWEHDIDPLTNIDASVNYSYLERETVSDERGMGMDLDFSRTLQQGTVSLTGNSEFTEGNRRGKWESLRGAWSVGGDMSYQLLKDLTSTVSANYLKRLVWGGSHTQNTYNYLNGSVGLSYDLGRWYSLSLDYAYYRLNTDTTGVDDYRKHRVFLGITAFWGTASTETARERGRPSTRTSSGVRGISGQTSSGGGRGGGFGGGGGFSRGLR